MKRLRVMLVVALAVGFLIAVVGLMSWRMEAGDVYPAYSSLRGDPLGTKALAESLDKLDGVTVERWYRPRLEAKPAAVFILGVTPDVLATLPADSIKELQDILDAGGRIILSLTSRMPDGNPIYISSGMGNKGLFREWNFDVLTDKNAPTMVTRLDIRMEISLRERFLNEGEKPLLPRDALPATIVWHGHLVFRDAPDWLSVYHSGVDSVIMERKIGQGSVVLLASSYLLSNEALHDKENRHPALLVALLGGHSRVVFDEYHLGIGEDPNLATLGRKYGLHWALACVALLAGLYMWKSMSPLLPPPAATSRPDVTGRSSVDGLVNLLRGSVPPGQLLHTCVDEWLKTPAGGPNLDKRLPRVMKIMQDVDEFEDKQRDTAGAYNEIVEAVNNKS